MRGSAVFAVAACGPYGAASTAAWRVAGTVPAAAVIFAAAKVALAGRVQIAARKHWLAAHVAIAAPPALFVRLGARRMGGQI
jgi:hypothetical protein